MSGLVTWNAAYYNPAVRNAFLIYNPASGRRRAKRTQDIERVAAVFRDAGIQVETCATTHPGSAIQQVQDAAARGFDTVVACGGDGTANEALNGIMRASSVPTQGARTSPDIALGLVPLGSGNLLASDLQLPSDPVTAAKKLLTYKPREFRPGLVSSQGLNGREKRYFLVAAGVGSDAELMYRTAVRAKERWGRNAYFLEMARMALHGRYPMFEVEWEDEQGNRRQGAAMLAMCVRAGRFPGLLSLVNLGTSLLRHDFCLLLFRTNKIRRFLSYFAGVATGQNWRVKDVEAIHTKWFRCTAIPGMKAVHSQADGELLGTLPAELTIESRPVKLLMG
jgi:diacylglycerol kinase (ATP)